MSDLMIRAVDVFWQPLADRMDVEVVEQRTQKRVARLDDVSARRGIRVAGLAPTEAYVVRIFPMRHRPVGRVVFTQGSGTKTVPLPCPIHPDRVSRVDFDDFDDVHPELQRVLEASGAVEGHEGTRGSALFAALEHLPKAGLLNLFAKMDRTRFEDGSSVAGHVDSLYRIRGDRIFGDIRKELRDKVKTAAAAGHCEEVSGALHEPPPGFHNAGSFKTFDPFGNLQLSFFASDDDPLRFKVDADIDDANGIRHIFQVLRNWIGHTATHPFDIHQILVFRQELIPHYRLVA